jgi:hypothetical protein
MKRILLSAFCLVATIASATKTSVKAALTTLVDWEDPTMGYFVLDYSEDFGYGANTDYSVDTETNSVTASATAGLYSNMDLVAYLNLYGLFDLFVKVATVPISVTPISTSFQWTHPLALSQGEEMTGVINAGYEYTIGDVQVYYYINNLMPRISILDYLLGDTNSLIPGDISQSSWAND